MAFKDLSDSLHDVSDKFQEFTTSSLEFYKLRLFKSSMKGAISLVNLLVFGSIFLIVLLFLSIGLALWLGTLANHPYVGFLIVGGLYAVLLVLIVLYGKPMIESAILLKFSKLYFDEDDDENEMKGTPTVVAGSPITPVVTPQAKAETEARVYTESLQDRAL